MLVDLFIIWMAAGLLGSLIEIIICAKDERSMKTCGYILLLSVFGPFNLMAAAEEIGKEKDENEKD